MENKERNISVWKLETLIDLLLTQVQKLSKMFDTKTRKSTIASPLWAVVGLYCSDDSDDEGNVDTMDHKEPSKSRRNSTESGASSKSGTCMNRAVNHPLPVPLFSGLSGPLRQV